MFGARDGDVRAFSAVDLPDMLLTGIDASAAAAVLSERTGATVSAAVRDDLMGRTGGNPLELVELPDVLSAAQLSGAVRLPGSSR